MQIFSKTAILVAISCALTSQAQAKSYNSCKAAFDHYRSDTRPHKAFATTNGSIPDHGDMACGGSGGNDLGRAIYGAMSACTLQAKKDHFSGKCRIIRKQ